MGIVLLFDTVKRKYFDSLDDEKKKKRNFIIKEDDGSVSKYIANLEGAGGGSADQKIFELSAIWTGEPDYTTYTRDYISINSAKEIKQYMKDNELNFCFHISDKIIASDVEGETSFEYFLHPNCSVDLGEAFNCDIIGGNYGIFNISMLECSDWMGLFKYYDEIFDYVKVSNFTLLK
jgi:hypothetical protein